MRAPVQLRRRAAAAVVAYDLVRCGIASYGLSPAPDVVTAAELGLVPAMTARARLALVKRHRRRRERVLRPHLDRRARHDASGLVPVGYGDGVPRHASSTGAGPGRRPAAAGRAAGSAWTSSWSTSAATSAAAGDEVVLFGAGADGAPTAQDWAEACGTISYEIVTRIGGPRSTRRHVVGDGDSRTDEQPPQVSGSPPRAPVRRGRRRPPGVVVERRVVGARAPRRRATDDARRACTRDAGHRASPTTACRLHAEVDECADAARRRARRTRRAPRRRAARPSCSCTATR